MKNTQAHFSRGDWGIMYWSPFFYRMAMAGLRPWGERQRMFLRIAEMIGDGSVLDLCCGPGDLRPFIPQNRYHGIDQNPRFVESLTNQNADAVIGDILATDWPESDCVVMVDSLYHFMNRWDSLWLRINNHGSRRVILSEPVSNWHSTAPNWLLPLGDWVTRVGGEHISARFTPNVLQQRLGTIGFQRIFRQGHNLIAVWDRHD